MKVPRTFFYKNASAGRQARDSGCIFVGPDSVAIMAGRRRDCTR